MSGQLHAPAALLPGKVSPLPIGKEVGWTPVPVRMARRRENSWPYRDSNSDPSVVQPVASRYTDYAIPAPTFRNNAAKLHLHPLRHSGEINNNVLKLWLLLDLQAIHCKSAATLETVIE
jgi:hypothetical protein